MFGPAGEVIGQILGGLVVITGFVSLQMKTSGKLLLFQIITSILFTAHYFFLGAFTAVVLNLICLVQCIVYYFRDKRGSKDLFWPIFFTVAMIIAGIFTYDGWQSLLITIGLIVLVISLSLPNTQWIRYSMFIKSPFCLSYNLIVFSIGGVVFECAMLISTIIGTIRYYSDKKKEKTIHVEK